MTLITIALLAFFTPLLPLAPPDKHHTEFAIRAAEVAAAVRRHVLA